MIKSKRLLVQSITLIIVVILLIFYNLKAINISSNSIATYPTKVGVLLYNLDDIYVSLIKQNLEAIEKENKDKIKFTYFDGKGNIAIQSEVIDKLFHNNYDLLMISLIEEREALVENIIYKAKQSNIPIILYNTTPVKTDLIRAYDKSVIINSDLKHSAYLQGQILVNEWNNNKSIIDKNNDNIMQYVMLKGKGGSLPTIIRTTDSILAVNNAGIQTQEVTSLTANWSKELARNAISSLFLRYGNLIEVIIANNDAMAIGAIEALQQYGYNMGDKSKNIPVVGIDAIPEAQALIDKGLMTGSVLQSPRELAEALYTVGMNLVTGKNPTEGTNYQFDDTGVTITLPYEEYTSTSDS